MGVSKRRFQEKESWYGEQFNINRLCAQTMCAPNGHEVALALEPPNTMEQKGVSQMLTQIKVS